MGLLAFIIFLMFIVQSMWCYKLLLTIADKDRVLDHYKEELNQVGLDRDDETGKFIGREEIE